MKRIQRYFFAILIVLSMMLLSACGQSGQPTDHAVPPEATNQSNTTNTTQSSDRPETDPSHNTAEFSSSAVPASNSPVPANRVSVKRYGDSSVIQSESGLYTLAQIIIDNNSKTASGSYGYGDFILYCDKESDEFVFLCGRPECLHNDENCDAFLGHVLKPIGYYNNHLYYVRIPTPNSNSSLMLCRMDVDGRNKMDLTTLYSKDESNTVKGGGFVSFTDGYFQISLQVLNQAGEIQNVQRYCSLDDPSILIDTALESKHPGTGDGIIASSDGNDILVMDFFDGDQSLTEEGIKLYEYLYIWDPKSNTLEPVGDWKNQVSGYFDKSSGYYIEDGVIRQWDYATKEGKDLFDTGLRKNLILNCYTDCLVISETCTTEEQIDTVSLWFYDWDFKSLGECKVTFEEARWYPFIIMSETENRIILGDPARSDLPIWYIEKSDFGTGTITLHEYHYPEMDLLE